ncbi:MAG: LytTR family transcriptional regulator [Proteobacteria bacterium]|nr:LytTR family transcriptional regulator [Pseudomonadota bacterium]
MSTFDLAEPVPPRLPAWLSQSALGFAHWLVFLLTLEPGNLIRAADAGTPLSLGHEVPRLLAAALMGAAVTPLLFRLIKRFPLEGRALWRNGAILALAVGLLALGLIVASCFPAAWWFGHGRSPSTAEIVGTVTDNWALLVYCMAAFIAIVQVVRARRAKAQAPVAAAPILVSARGRVDVVDPARIDWVETQGNYLALHVGAASHLIRETLARFEQGPEGARFVRIHRRMLVALDRIEALRPLSNGDATLTLRDGRTLRLSRSYRQAVAERIAAQARAR